MTTENPFDGREYDGRVFSTRHERNFFIGRLSRSQQKEWLRDHPDRWQTREDFLRDLQAHPGLMSKLNHPRRAPRSRQMRWGPVASPTFRYRRRMRTTGCLTSRQRIQRHRRLPMLKRPPLLAMRSLSATDDFSVSVASLQCWATARGSCNAGAKKGKVLRARRLVAGCFMKSTNCGNG